MPGAKKKSAPVDTTRVKRDLEKLESRRKLSEARIDSAVTHHPKMKMGSAGGKRLLKEYNNLSRIENSLGSKGDTLNEARKDKIPAKRGKK